MKRLVEYFEKPGPQNTGACMDILHKLVHDEGYKDAVVASYLDNQWKPLTRFVRDPVLEIHNNDSERALRHLVTGRKNWLFFGSPEGARVGANLFSLVATCKALEINPVTYLEDILYKVDTTPASEIAKLTPWAWAAEAGEGETT